MASVTFKITKKSNFHETPTDQDPVVNGRIIFVMDDSGTDDNRIYLDYKDQRKLYATALNGGGGEVQPGDHKSFLGISTVEPINGDKPVVDGIGEVTNANSGEWVAVQGSSKEYYWDGREWKPFGDENAEAGEIAWNDDDINS